ncbi:MAG: indole-3-glycerol phosphate synthase TrpC [Actinobacteria bacterium]|nr:indole-3-glycerol phosphate synthase TrpC [Actinomycetota bacterium]
MFLEDAVSAAAASLCERMEATPAASLERALAVCPEPPDFTAAVSRGGGGVKIIAEVKRMSPSAGSIREDAPVAELVRAYCDAGAAAVSVLTSEYKFGGRIADLLEAGRASDVPLLRKDFIIDPYQVLESRVHGASAVLLLAAVLTVDRIRALEGYARELGMTALVEAHDRADLEKVLDADSLLVGINNRDLATLEVDVRTTDRLLPHIPEGHTVVSESGIRTRDQVIHMEELGIDALLVGEALMRAGEPGAMLKQLLGEVDESCGSRSAG